MSSPRGTGHANMVPRLRLGGDVSGGMADTVTITVTMLIQLVVELRPTQII